MAGQAVNALEITADLLVKQNLNPEALQKSLHSYSFYPNQESQSFEFTAEQKKLYDQYGSLLEQAISDALENESFRALVKSEGEKETDGDTEFLIRDILDQEMSNAGKVEAFLNEVLQQRAKENDASFNFNI